MEEQLTQLGKTPLQISWLGLGAWSWGDRMVWSYGHGYTDQDIRAAFDASLEAGINWVDTAEVYGNGRSERLLGSFLPTAGREVLVATKFFPFPWRLRRAALLKALRGSLKRLGLARVDLYQIHSPWSPFSIEHWVEGLAEAVQAGLVQTVGVSNYNEDQMRRANSVLARYGLPLASNQVPYSLLDRRVETNGLLKACQDLGITLIAYSPLAQGALTGKYTPQKPLPGVRGRRWNPALLERIQPLLKRMREIGQEHGGRSPSQVALNWAICKGTVPIPGAKNARQAQENAGALGWRLTPAEVAELDQLSAGVA
jgi:aryl-alcohol dehydrogenase-like predicted oxidoreductase